MKGPFISRVHIKNFRNFKDVDIFLSHKQVILGENNVGKTNFLRAIQLILDPTFSDRDRNLSSSDFHDSIERPMENGESIEISIEIKNYENNTQLVARFQDAVVSDTPPTIKLTYKFEPIKDDKEKIIGYQYIILLGNSDQSQFTYKHRELLNIQVIKALRDVEREMKGLKRSPLFQLVKQYEIKDEELENIAEELRSAASVIMQLDELVELKNLVQSKFDKLSGHRHDNQIDLSTFDIDTERLLQTIQVLMGEKRRPVSEISLGFCNILYISLMLLLIRDRTVPTIIKTEKWNELFSGKSRDLLEKFYTKNENGNFIFDPSLYDDEEFAELYTFMNKNLFPSQSFTILAVEEPEAHLHPVLQRLIYSEVLQKSGTSVIFTTHSTHITSVAPIDSLVHISSDIDRISSIHSAANISISSEEKMDIERYIDAKRGELFFGNAIILVEGIAEEFLIPKFAELLDHPLDNLGIVVCSINSTNFKPYVQLLDKLGIHWCLIADGDYYEKENGIRSYHRLISDAGSGSYLGLEIIKDLLVEINLLQLKNIPEDNELKFQLFAEQGCFIGNYTFEVDILSSSDEDGLDAIKDVFSQLRTGGELVQKRFEKALEDGEYWEALHKIESKQIGKGRFAQRLSAVCTKDMIPEYVKNAIGYIINKVMPPNE